MLLNFYLPADFCVFFMCFFHLAFLFHSVKTKDSWIFPLQKILREEICDSWLSLNISIKSAVIVSSPHPDVSVAWQVSLELPVYMEMISIVWRYRRRLLLGNKSMTSLAQNIFWQSTQFWERHSEAGWFWWRVKLRICLSVAIETITHERWWHFWKLMISSSSFHDHRKLLQLH